MDLQFQHDYLTPEKDEIDWNKCMLGVWKYIQLSMRYIDEIDLFVWPKINGKIIHSTSII